MSLTILSVAYPLAPVSPDCVGGAEQVLSMLDRGLVAAGHRSIVVAQAGSRVVGTLVATAAAPAPLDERALAAAQGHHRKAIASVLARQQVDLVHLHGIDFPAYMPPFGVPVLATLHLPVSWYPPGALAPRRPATWLNCVSESQHRDCPTNPALTKPIANGVDVASFGRRHRRRNFALVLGRICPEKGIHLAIDAAHRADIALVVAGEVFSYEAHRRYFDEEVVPRLDARRRFVGPVGFARKRRLLGAARCLLVPSLAPETSSLVAREAAASGTPVIAFPNGALAETVEHGRTGFLVDDVDAMASAIVRSDEIDPETCRAVAARRFAADEMVAAYLDCYAHLAVCSSPVQGAA